MLSLREPLLRIGHIRINVIAARALTANRAHPDNTPRSLGAGCKDKTTCGVNALQCSKICILLFLGIMSLNLNIIIKIIVYIIIVLFLIFLLSRGHIYPKEELEYGITFSKKQAEELGLDWQEAYIAIFDLGAKKMRLPAYWSEIEPTSGQFGWDDLDWQLEQARKRGVEVILAVGGRLPRWPECHFPDWAENLTKEQREQKILEYIEKVVLRYIGEDSIVAWQVENEPFLSHFGDCPEFSSKFLDKEIALVRSFDDRPIVLTDSGELSIWMPAARRADIFGTTMYRDTYSKVFKRYIHYPIRPGFFRFKKNIAAFFTHPEKWIVIELQAEPWGPIPYQNLSKEERGRTMDLEKFRKIIEFSSQTGFKEFYLWGAEWWYWEKTVNGDESLWNEAKKLFVTD
jgi:hypothetical protein